MSESLTTPGHIVTSCLKRLELLGARLDNLETSIRSNGQPTEALGRIGKGVRMSTEKKVERLDALVPPTRNEEYKGVSSRRTTSAPLLHEDIWVLIIEAISNIQMSDGFPSIATGAITELKSLRFVSKLLSELAAKSLFTVLVIGQHPSSNALFETPPLMVLQCAKYVSLRRHAFSIYQCAWLGLLKSTKGLQCPLHPHWDKLANSLGEGPTKLTHLSIKLNGILPQLFGFNHFETCISYLAATLESISIDMVGCGNGYQSALHVIQFYLPRLTSVRFQNLDSDHSKAAFVTTGWACKDSLKSLYLSKCSLVFRFLSRFIAYASFLENLVVEDCSAWDAVEGVAFLELPSSRVLKRLELPQYCGKGLNCSSIAIIQPKTSKKIKDKYRDR